MKVALVLVLFCVAVFGLQMKLKEPKVRFDGQQVIRANVSEGVLQALNFDVWADFGTSVDVRVNSEQLRVLREMGVEYTVKIPDLQALLDDHERELTKSPVWSPAEPLQNFFQAYQTYPNIVAYSTALAATYSYVTFYQRINSVPTTNNQLIHALSIDTGALTKPRLYIQGQQHAREWIACATVLFVVSELLERYEAGDDPEAVAILNYFNMDIVPMVNPDGYLYTWASNRLWRKNRKPNAGGTFGVDLNRNWQDIYNGQNIWCTQGASTQPGSDTYCGTAPFSEIESKAASDWFQTRRTVTGAEIPAGIDYHSYSQLVLRPYGNTYNLPPNEAALKACGDAIADAIWDESGLTYTSQNSIMLYPTTGTAEAYIYQQTDASYGYTIELRDTGQFGFVLPPAQIIPTGRENYQGFKAFALHVMNALEKQKQQKK